MTPQDGDRAVLRFVTRSVEQTQRAAAALARAVASACPGSGGAPAGSGAVLDRPLAIALDGDLGAGKTHFSQAFACQLGVTEAVTSPTFAIVEEHRSGWTPLFHFDLYRLERPDELEGVGFFELCEEPGIALIEWAQKFEAQLPLPRIAVRIAVGEDGARTFSVTPPGTDAYEADGDADANAFVARVLDAWRTELAHAGEAGAHAAAEDAATMADASTAPADATTAVPSGTSTAADASAATTVPDGPSASDNASMPDQAVCDLVLAFDTAHETVSVAVGRLRPCTDRVDEGDTAKPVVETLAARSVSARRASNTLLTTLLGQVLDDAGATRAQVACVACGRGPGSFTGVRICLATAKGVALGLDVPLFGVSTLDALAWDQQRLGVRGPLAVLADAMRKEVYPVRYALSDGGVTRLSPDAVIKAADASAWVGDAPVTVAGDALFKYEDLVKSQLPQATVAPREAWTVSGEGLLAAFQQRWREGIDPWSKRDGNPSAALPVYTRLSDAEEHERARNAKAAAQPAPKNLATGVGAAIGQAALRYEPLDGAWVEGVADLEARAMGSDAWNAAQIADELPRSDRTWWAAYQVEDPTRQHVGAPGEGARLAGYAGGWVVDGQLQILKVAVEPELRRHGVAQELLSKLAHDARDLGAHEATLEVRASNTGAHAFYERLGLACEGVRPRYYSDREDACIYTGPLPLSAHDVAGMSLRVGEAVAGSGASADNRAGSGDGEEGATSHDALRGRAPGQDASRERGLIVAFETSCDETAAAMVDAAGMVVSDVVASQIDFHARFGGVVPEIASRKHIEAIAGVAQETLEQARLSTGDPTLAWRDLAAVSVTTAPGLVSALVVGLAFAKGLAWAIDKPLIEVNHLEGHLYANRLACPQIEPPMVVSLVSGGHTMLVHVKDWGSYETLGTTLDDAVGEAFDKVAKALGLSYPGGPLISRLAEKGDPKAVRFPRALLHSGDLQFSLSGLKTSVLTYLQKERQAGREPSKEDVAASFQAAVVDVQVAKARAALEQTGARELCLGGGVAANPALREAYERLCEELGVRLTMPPLAACTDNAAMIALVAADRFAQGKFSGLDCDVRAHAPLDEPY